MGFAVEMRHITKAFSGVKAIDDVSLQIEEGDIHALIGENGAGKSTLMNVLSGSFSHHTYEGDVLVGGKQVKLLSPDDANRAGIVMVHQELAMIPEISVAENVFLGHMPRNHTGIDWKTVFKKAEDALKRLSLDIDVKSKVKYLSVGQQQLVEIAKAIMMGGRVLILDEPTAPLTDRETETLFRILKELKNEGITIIYISHRLEEIFKLTDSVSVMRDGNLEILDYSVPHPEYDGKHIVNHVSMEFRRGEIVGISGLLGAGRTELMMAVTGGYRIAGKGKMKLDGKEILFKCPKEAIRSGIGFVTEDRKGNGLIVDKSLCFNLTLAALDKIRTRRMLNQKKESSFTEKFIKDLGIKSAGMHNPVKSLSGGNQQKVVLAKWLATDPRILILDEPTRGGDVGAKYEIYTIMKELAKAGVAIIMISSDLAEVIGMSDRVYIMSEGNLTGELKKEMLTEENIMKYATNTVNEQR